jgi:hypothetical protein
MGSKVNGKVEGVAPQEGRGDQRTMPVPAPPPGGEERDGSRRAGTRLLAPLVNQVQADEPAAMARVAALRRAQPHLSTDQLVEQLIRRKCQQAAFVGAITSGASLVPGLGTIIALTVGTAADVGAMLRLQAELVLEIAAAHGRTMSGAERERILVLITGVSVGSGQLLTRGSQSLAQRIGGRFASRWVTRALPVAGVAAAVGTNALTTYVIGRRAHAYFGLGPQEMRSWQDELRALSGLDERKLGDWLATAGARTREVAGGGTGRVAGVGRRAWQGAARGVKRVSALLPRRSQKALPPPPAGDSTAEATTAGETTTGDASPRGG